MTLSGKAMAGFVIVLVAVGGLFGIYYLDTSSTLTSQNETVSSLQHSLSSLMSNPPSTTTTIVTTSITDMTTTTTNVTTSITDTTTVLTSVVSTQTVKSASTVTVPQFPGVPWSSPSMFLISDPSGSGGPTFGANLTEVVVFNCTNEAASPQGCTRQVNVSARVPSSYTITVWYPFPVNQTSAKNDPYFTWANCAYSAPSSGLDHHVAYCISLGPNNFIMALPQPGPE